MNETARKRIRILSWSNILYIHYEFNKEVFRNIDKRHNWFEIGIKNEVYVVGLELHFLFEREHLVLYEKTSNSRKILRMTRDKEIIKMFYEYEHLYRKYQRWGQESLKGPAKRII